MSKEIYYLPKTDFVRLLGLENCKPMTALSMKSLTEQIYQTIRADILSCRHRPGARLKINVLCQELDASLGAVRESLSRLAAEGFVQSEARKGFRVSPVSLKDLEDLTKTRITIENMCLGESIRRGGLEWETGVVGAFHRLSRLPEVGVAGDAQIPKVWSEAHETFHSSLVSACGSEWLLRIRAMLFDQADRYRRLCAISVHSVRDVTSEHRAIMEAVLARDEALACHLMAKHLQRTADTVAELVSREYSTV